MEIKLLEIHCNFQNYLGTDKRHFKLRSENKIFQYFTGSLTQAMHAYCSTQTLPRQASVCSFRFHSDPSSIRRAAWNLVQSGHKAFLQESLKKKKIRYWVPFALNSGGKSIIHWCLQHSLLFWHKTPKIQSLPSVGSHLLCRASRDCSPWFGTPVTMLYRGFAHFAATCYKVSVWVLSVISVCCLSLGEHI